jgi:alkylated DNA repair dioxygenase AlkB
MPRIEEIDIQPIQNADQIEENQMPGSKIARVFDRSIKITCGGKLKALFLKAKDNPRPISNAHYNPALKALQLMRFRSSEDSVRPMVKQSKIGGDLTLGWLGKVRSGREDFFRANNRDQLFLAMRLVPLIGDLEAAMQIELPDYYQFHMHQASKLLRPPGEKLKTLHLVKDPFHRQLLEKWDATGYYHFHGSKAFSTLTLNDDILFGAHCDGSNMPGTLSCLTALGEFVGYLNFPRLGIGFDVQPYDVLISDTNEEFHCSNEMVIGSRYTIVAYLHGSCDKGWRPVRDDGGRLLELRQDKSLIGSIADWHGVYRPLQASMESPEQSRTKKTPTVWDCHKGKNYPADAVYVGCRVLSRTGKVIREGSIFGNGVNPLVSHRGALHSESEFRAYAIAKLKDPEFRAEAEKLRGRDLLCWCVQEGKRRAEFCHARVWLELINNSKEVLTRAGSVTERQQDFEWGDYDPNFLRKEEADALFEMAKTQPRYRPVIKRSGHPLRRCAGPCWSVRDRNRDDSVGMIPLTEAPQEIISLQNKLSQLAGKEVNYFAVQVYENGRDHIGWHQHREDKCRDARVYIISLGERRSFGLHKLCPDCLLCDNCNRRRCHPDGPPCSNRAKCKAARQHRKTCAVRKSTKIVLLPSHGSLIALSSEANNWFEHAILDDAEPKGLRISINTKCIPPEDATAGYVPRELRITGGFSQK